LSEVSTNEGSPSIIGLYGCSSREQNPILISLPAFARSEPAVMDEEMSFPNPVVRSDLPAGRRPWKRFALGAVLLIGVLGVVFLPQVLHSRVGRRLLRARLEWKYNAEVSIQDFSTSWFGGTVVNQFWFKMADGRVIGFNALRSDVSLWKLLRGRYALGNCAVDGLAVDFSFENADGRHSDTYELLTGLPPRSATSPPPLLARVSGKISLYNSQLNLFRTEVDPKSFNMSFQTVRFTNLNGQLDIPSGLDQPWTYKMQGAVGVSGEERGQSFESAGTLKLGEGGQMVLSAVQADATFDAKNMPTDIGPVLLPLFAAEDYRSALGPTLDTFKVALKGDGGVLRLEVSASNGQAQVHAQPTFDLTVYPPLATMASKDPADNWISAALPTGPLHQDIGMVNPFAAEASGGTFVARVTSLKMPVGRFWNTGALSGELELHDAKITQPPLPSGADRPRSLAGQVAILSGDAKATLPLQSMPVGFALDNGAITLTPTTFTLGTAQLTLAGGSTMEGALKMRLAIGSPQLKAQLPEPGAIEMPLGGTVAQPKLDVDAAMRLLPAEAAAKLKDWIARQTAAVRARDAEAGLREQERQVKDQLKSFSADEVEKK
jgi:hypothetical protein